MIQLPQRAVIGNVVVLQYFEYCFDVIKVELTNIKNLIRPSVGFQYTPLAILEVDSDFLGNFVKDKVVCQRIVQLNESVDFVRITYACFFLDTSYNNFLEILRLKLKKAFKIANLTIKSQHTFKREQKVLETLTKRVNYSSI